MADELLHPDAIGAAARAGIGTARARLWAHSRLSGQTLVPAALLLALALLAPACASRPAPIEDGIRVRVAALEARVDAVAGRTLVARVSVTPIVFDPETVDPDRTLTSVVPVTIGGQRPIAGSLHRVRALAPEEPPSRAWLAPTRSWEARSSGGFAVREALDPPADGFWVLLVDLPEGARGEVRVTGQRIPVEWREARRAPRRPAAMTVATPMERRFLDMLAPAAADPAARWRVRLLSDRRPPGVPGLADALDASLGGPVLDALDQHLTDRWRVALSILDDADPALAQRVHAALTRVVSVQGQLAPAWSADEDAAAALLEGLLNPAYPAQSRADRAAAWLAGQPPFLAWVLDDAGSRTPGAGVAAVALGVAEMEGEPVIVRARAGDAEGPALGVAPWASGVSVVSIDEADAPAQVEVRVESRSAVLPVAPAPIAAEPPGARIGPLLETWTMAHWLAGRPSPPPAEWATAAMLMKEPVHDRWTLYIECRTPPDLFVAASGEDELLRVHLGATGAPAAVIRVRATGFAQDETTFEDVSGEIAVRRLRDRWTVMLPIPAHAIDRDGVLRIGVERIDARAQRTTWPRPVLPWQDAPGRIAFDLARWNELRE